MPGVRKFEHASLCVPNVEETAAFYEEVMGLRRRSSGDTVRLEIDPETHYDLYDDHYTLALEDGNAGLDHFAVRVTESELESAESRLANAGVEYEVSEGAEPGQQRAIQTLLPGGLSIELEVVEKTADIDRQDVLPHSGVHHAPKGQDHITLASPDVKADAEFLRDVLGFKISDVAMAGPDMWGMAFTRWGDHHHDVALIVAPTREQTGLHHIAWQMTDLNHMKQLVDVLGKAGHEVDIDFTRHVLGNNVSLYFRDPAGHRVEITTEVAKLDADTPTTFHEEDPNNIVTFWDGTHPPLGEKEDH
ncbi:VOC family protein [Halostagnicola bangensis]